MLDSLEFALQNKKHMTSIMRQVFNEACKEAQKMEEFASDYPALIGVFLTFVALRVLYLLWLAILAALRFCEDGVMLSESQIY